MFIYILQQVWAKKIEERILNVKRKASRNKRKEMELSGIEVVKQKPGRKSRTGKKMVEVPAFPLEETEASLEEHHKELEALTKTKPFHVHRARQLMELTYPLRRREIVINNSHVWQIMKQYPCLAENRGAEVSHFISNMNWY